MELTSRKKTRSATKHCPMCKGLLYVALNIHSWLSATPSLRQSVASVHECAIALERLKWQGWTVGYGLHTWLLQWGQVSSRTKVQQCPGEGEGISDIHHSLLSQNYRRQHQWDSSPQESSLPISTGYSLDQRLP